LRIESAGQSFDYEHVLWDTFVVDGTTVTTDTVIGKIDPTTPGGAHLHLNEIISQASRTIRVNPQFEGQLSYTDNDRPDFSTATVGAVVDAPIIFIQAGTESNPQPFLYRGGEFYVNGNVDILVTARNGGSRKGLFRVFTDADPIRNSVGVPFNPLTTIGFTTLRDGETPDTDVRRIYWKRWGWADTYIPTNVFLGGGAQGPQSFDAFWDTTVDLAETRQVCVWLADHPPPNSHYKSRCEIVLVDNITPLLTLADTSGTPFTQATSSTSVVVKGNDSNSGIYAIGLVGVSYSSWHYVGGVSTFASNTFPDSGSLANGAYTAYVVDLASNVTSGEFRVWTGTGPSSGANSHANPLPENQKSTDCFTAVTADTVAGIDSITFSKDGGGYSQSAIFQCASEVEFGPFCNLAAGSYTARIQNCAETEWTYASTVTAASNSFEICGTNPASQTTCSSNFPTAAQLLGTSSVTVKTTGGGFPISDIGKMCLGIAASALGGQQAGVAGCSVYDGSNNNVKREFEGPASWWAGTSTFRVWNANPGSTQAVNVGLEIRVEFYDLVGNKVAAGINFIAGGSPDYYADPGEGIDGTISVSEVGQPYPIADGSQVFKSSPTIKNVQISSETLSQAMWVAIRRGVLAFSALPRWMTGSEIVFTSTIPISFTYQDSPGGVQTSTSSLRIYRWSGVEWDSSPVTGLWVSKDGGSGVIIASGAVSRTGLYAAMFDGQDSSAPNTAWSIQGSSSGFAGTTFVSTYSYLVVSSTDPTVNGFASGVATTYYRIDGLPGDAYSVYSTSLSFLPGTHWVDSYAEDYAGNISSVTRATVTVTAGSVTQLTSSLQVDGNLLVGFLGSGAKAEVVARAEYDYALMVSSVDGRAMLAVDNANFASIGTAPASGRLTLAGVAGDAALALRSGNSTASVTGAQLAFGYDGTSDMRHALYTQHGSADYNNKLVFKLWTPAAGSSSTLGNLPVLSLEGSSKTASGALVHIMPAGLGENELVVSNGSGLGLGNVLRWERWQPSDSKLKTGIERLGPKDVARAWADLMSLKPARYRRKAKGPAAPLERGYILEEVPKSLRIGSGISVDERLVTVELALKGAIAEMNALEERLRKLKAGRR
jgi:hypothetical protein